MDDESKTNVIRFPQRLRPSEIPKKLDRRSSVEIMANLHAEVGEEASRELDELISRAQARVNAESQASRDFNAILTSVDKHLRQRRRAHITLVPPEGGNAA